MPELLRPVLVLPVLDFAIADTGLRPAEPKTQLCLFSEHLVHRGEYLLPVPFLFGQLRPSRRRQSIKLGAASIFQLAPLTLDPAFFGQPVQGRKKRPRAHHKNSAGYLLNTVRDADAVQGTKFKSTKDEEI